MSGICSRHFDYIPECIMCNSNIEDLLPNYKEKCEEAEKAGKYKCLCGFTYYLTTNICPKCNRKYGGKP